MSRSGRVPGAPRPELPDDEPARLAALRATRLLDSPREQSFDDLVALAAAVTGASMSAVSLVDADRQWFKACWGFEASQTALQYSLCAHAILQPRQMLVVEDTLADPRFAGFELVGGPLGVRFYAGVPLLDGEGNPLGTLCVFDTRPRGQDAVQATALRALARQAGYLIELRRTTEALNLQMRERAWYEQQLLHYSQLLEEQNADLALQTRTDPLTGLTNRRGFGEALALAVEQAAADGLPLSVAILDLDHFKAVNDAWGHAEGDRVLARAGRLLASHVQHPALAGRYGGEEFAVLLPGMDLAQAHGYCLQLCRAVAALEGNFEVTTSIGVSQWRADEEPLHALTRADAALYRAKQGGRNRVETAS